MFSDVSVMHKVVSHLNLIGSAIYDMPPLESVTQVQEFQGDGYVVVALQPIPFNTYCHLM